MQNQPQQPTKNTDTARIQQVVDEYYGNMPHADIPGLKWKDYETFENVAADMFESQISGQRPSLEHVAHAFQALKAIEMSPADFQHTWQLAKPLSQRLLDRDPTLVEVARLRNAGPGEMHAHYMNHPYPGYEEVTAGQMARYWRAMEPISRKHGQEPNLETVSRAAIAGWTSEDMHHYYRGW